MDHVSVHKVVYKVIQSRAVWIVSVWYSGHAHTQCLKVVDH